jgi:diguanylate cyclase (GGDEF)-like protein
MGDEWIVPVGSRAPQPPATEGPWWKAVATGETVVEASEAGPFRAVWSMPVADPTSADRLGAIVVWSELHDEPLLGWWATLGRVVELAGLALGRLRAESALAHAATHDVLTGLLNRAGFVAGADEAPRGAVLVVDLDHFKAINDRHGHAVGDAVLQIAAQRLTAVLRPGDVVARFGGDELVVLLPGGDGALAADVAQRIIDTVSAPLAVGGVQVTVGASIGIDAGVSASSSLDDQLSRADAALYEAKHAGRNAYRVA